MSKNKSAITTGTGMLAMNNLMIPNIPAYWITTSFPRLIFTR
jgi:hypothetical protein